MTEAKSAPTEVPQQEDANAADHVDFSRTIQRELEQLNKSSSEINAFESRLEVERSSYAELYELSQRETAALGEKLRKSIENARPYFEAKLAAKEANLQSQKAAWRFEKARSVEDAAKEMVDVVEKTYFSRNEMFGTDWQDTLNAALGKVNEAEKERIEVELEHHRSMLAYREAEERSSELRKTLRKHVERAEAYFNAVERFGGELAERKSAIERLERDVAVRKRDYASALRHLELISNEVHRLRAAAGETGPKSGENTDNTPLKPDSNSDGGDCQNRPDPPAEATVNQGDFYRSNSLTSLSTTNSSVYSSVQQSNATASSNAITVSTDTKQPKFEITRPSDGDSQHKVAQKAGTEAGNRESTAKNEDQRSQFGDTSSNGSVKNRPSSAGSASSTQSNSSAVKQRSSENGCKLHLPAVDLLRTSLQHASHSYVSYEKRVAFERQSLAENVFHQRSSTDFVSSFAQQSMLAGNATGTKTGATSTSSNSYSSQHVHSRNGDRSGNGRL